ncbi:pyocin knob domain-containing protein [Liquorilactobacillus uvarum]|uniref:pyocin knob domain-containing protein n=1 Tax=Liquorilactobacillus uvarum TaxID=303240 RepID=UPI002889DEFA|nr:pyocin knob domain-containing protein [Liquorilactobacillus uvarum]
MSYEANLTDDNNETIFPRTGWTAVQGAPDFAGQIKNLQDSLGQKQDTVSSFAYHNDKNIDGNTDLNTIVDSGIYTIFSNNGHISGTHWFNASPDNSASTTGDWGFMMVIGFASGLKLQVVFAIPGDIYIRGYAGSPASWEGWRKVQYNNVN